MVKGLSNQDQKAIRPNNKPAQSRWLSTGKGPYSPIWKGHYFTNRGRSQPRRIFISPIRNSPNPEKFVFHQCGGFSTPAIRKGYYFTDPERSQSRRLSTRKGPYSRIWNGHYFTNPRRSQSCRISISPIRNAPKSERSLLHQSTRVPTSAIRKSYYFTAPEMSQS